MDDKTRTNQTLDKLASMYLTNIDEEQQGVARGDEAVVSNDTSMSNVDLKQSQAAALLDELEGPAPIRLQPKVTANDNPPLRLHHDQAVMVDDEPVVAEHSVVQWSDDDDGTDERDSDLAHYVEAVFMGHLPGFAGPWLTQYAFYLSQRRGPVAILHIDGEQVDIDLVGSRFASRQSDAIQSDYASLLDDDLTAAGAYASEQAADDLVKQLDELSRGIGGMQSPVRTWLLHMQEDSTLGTMSMARRLSNWTVLSGANDAAVVAAYRMLRAMFVDDENSATVGSHRLGVMMVGSDEDKSRAAAKKLSSTVAGFAGEGVDLIGWQKQMVPIVMQSLGSVVSNGDSLWPAVYSYLDELSREGGEELLVVAPEVPEAESSDIEPVEEMTVDDGPVVEQPKIETPVFEESQQATGSMMQTPSAHVADIKAIEKPMAEVQATVEEDDETVQRTETKETVATGNGELDLTAYVTGACNSLAARCPRDQNTQLMLDESGQLHLLHRHEKAMDLRTCLLQLSQTSQWVAEHVELLQLTVPGLRIEGATRPTLHVFTGDAKDAVQMIASSPAVQFHLLQEVKVNGSSTWACTELN